MEYIAITLPYEVFKEANKINQLFEMGLDVLHIRKPLYSKSELKNLISEIHEEYHSKLVIHSHFSLLSSFNLLGIHIDISSLNSIKSYYFEFLKKIYNITISVTVNNILNKKLNNHLINYVFFGPLFSKLSEETTIQNFNAFELKKELSSFDESVYALGCSSLNNIQTADSIGFNGSVLQAYIWKSDDIINAFKTLLLNTNSETSIKKQVAI